MTVANSIGDSNSSVWHLRLAYQGGAYYGWQIQPDANTVQAELLLRLRRLFRQDDLKINASSRTDAGVHARDQNVSFLPAWLPTGMTPKRLRTLLNRWLPSDIQVTASSMEPSGFHARHSARAKAYTYVLRDGEDKSPFAAPFSWQHSAVLDRGRMREAADVLTGRHDFAPFSANPRREVESTIREIYRFEIISNQSWIYLNIIADGFLYKMARSLAGYLVDVGRASGWSSTETVNILADGRRLSKIRTAPPQGLFLGRVFYEAGQWDQYQPVLPPFV